MCQDFCLVMLEHCLYVHRLYKRLCICTCRNEIKNNVKLAGQEISARGHAFPTPEVISHSCYKMRSDGLFGDGDEHLAFTEGGEFLG